MDFYRVFVWDRTSQEKRVKDKIYPPRLKQGSGRYDIPDRDGVIYCSKSPISAIAEVLQGFRGTSITNKIFSRPDGKILALARIVLDDNIPLIDLNDPNNFLKFNLLPSQVATMNRITTQNIARSIFDEGVHGFTWWSTLEASWINATLFESRTINHMSIMDEIRGLNTNMAEVIEAAQALNIEIDT